MEKKAVKRKERLGIKESKGKVIDAHTDVDRVKS